MHQILYLSTLSREISEADLLALLAQSRDYNRQHTITGLLLHGQGHFMQLLEGEASTVQALYARIQADTRHEQVTTLRAHEGGQRCFPAWAMAYYSLREPVDWPRSFLPLNQRLVERCQTWAPLHPELEPLHAFALQALPYHLRDALRF
ncbi:BLUF domain-containing protein [Hymenobacter sediminis]|uniref:BLUF domain-containing protein n=1 Tax=Hymenobacter sediminis TaxID=2218621 RepID=UPI000DA697EF|nr:BLUF domain-containing protein [Hymenobacter sediminis]RPD44156.1 BLUF domain-containing protein [Hymenobacter sediminis]